MKFTLLFVLILALLGLALSDTECDRDCGRSLIKICAEEGDVKKTFDSDCEMEVANTCDGHHFKQVSLGECPST